MEQPTMQQIQATQGTRLSQKAPWETYGDELDVKVDPQLAGEIERYAQTRYEESKGSEAKEELHRQQELNQDVAKQYQWLTPEEYKDVEPRIGTPMRSDVLIATLRKAGVKCWYREHPHADKLTLVYSDSDGSQPLEVACWVQYGWMPEFSIMRFDEHGVPLNERRRGWRTCLLQMILKGVIKESEAVRWFGEATGPASERYNSMLYEWRNRHVEAV